LQSNIKVVLMEETLKKTLDQKNCLKLKRDFPEKSFKCSLDHLLIDISIHV